MTRLDQLTPEEQFSLLLDGELRPDQVGDEIRSLFALSQELDERITVPRAEFGFRAQLRTQLVAAASGQTVGVWQRAREAVWMRTAQVRHSARAALASGLAASMIGTAGIAAAAQHALPGELLYPVKELTESARIALAGDLAATGRLHLRFAEERLEEIHEGAPSLAPGLLIDALQDMDDESIAGAEDLLGWATRTGDDAVLGELSAFTQRQRDGLQRVISRLPSAVVPFAEESLEILRRIDVEVAGEPEPCDCPDQVAGPVDQDGPSIGAPGQAPARAPQRPCGCTPGTDAPPTTREPVGDDDPGPGPDDDPGAGPAEGDPPPPDDDEPVDLIPELPGPLDGVGNVIDEAVNGVLDGAEPVTDPLPVDPEDDLLDPINETVDDLIGDGPLDDAPIDDALLDEPLPTPSLLP